MEKTTKSGYKAQSIQILDGKLDREINHFILDCFPSIFKSKVVRLATLKTKNSIIKFSESHSIKDLTARQLYDSVKKWRSQLEKNPLILLTQEQHDLILGSVLGDSSIRQRDKNCCFRVTHSKKQEKYIFWKYNILSDFSNKKPSFKIRKIKDYKIEVFNFSTFTHFVFNYYRGLFYENGKKRVTKDILDQLNPRSLAIWICDDGSYDTKQGYIVLCTNSYSLEEHRLMKKYFEETWDLSPTIGFRDKKYYYLRFKQADSKKLIKIIKPYIMNFMSYKIGEKNG